MTASLLISQDWSRSLSLGILWEINNKKSNICRGSYPPPPHWENKKGGGSFVVLNWISTVFLLRPTGIAYHLPQGPTLPKPILFLRILSNQSRFRLQSFKFPFVLGCGEKTTTGEWQQKNKTKWWRNGLNGIYRYDGVYSSGYGLCVCTLTLVKLRAKLDRCG